MQEFAPEVSSLLFLDEETLLSRDLYGTIRIYKIIDGEVVMRSGRNAPDRSLLGATQDKFVVSERLEEDEEFILTLLNNDIE